MQAARRRSTDAILFCSNHSHMVNDDTQKSFLSSGMLPGRIYEPRYFFRPNAMMRIGRRRRTFALPSSCQKISSIIFLQRQSSLPSPLFPRQIYESGLVFQPNVAMLAGRRRNMTKHAGGPPACSPGQTAEAERIGRVLAQAPAAPRPGRHPAEPPLPWGCPPCSRPPPPRRVRACLVMCLQHA